MAGGIFIFVLAMRFYFLLVTTHFFVIAAYDSLIRVFDLNVIPGYDPESHRIRMRF